MSPSKEEQEQQQEQQQQQKASEAPSQKQPMKKQELKRYEHFERDQKILLDALRRLSQQLSELDVTTVNPLTHYRQLPEPVVQAKDFLYNGAVVLHSTATKYSLLGTVDQVEQNKLKEDLIRGCNVMATGCVLVHEKAVGCSRALRKHIKRACRAVIDAVLQLVESFYNGSALVDHVGAQKAGIVWQACDVIIEKKVPIGNRNAIRRDLYVYMMECQETMGEFNGLIEKGAAPPQPKTDDKAKASTTSENDKNKKEGEDDEDEDDENDAAWDAFAEDEQLYLEQELPVATACVALVKVSRGTMNLTLQALEAVGSVLQEFLVNERDPTPKDRARFEWMERLYTLALKVGDGMTDFGTNLYPALDLKALPDQVQIHSQKLSQLVHMVMEATLTDKSKIAMPKEVIELAMNLKQATAARRNEALQAVAAAKKWEKKNNKKK